MTIGSVDPDAQKMFATQSFSRAQFNSKSTVFLWNSELLDCYASFISFVNKCFWSTGNLQLLLYENHRERY